MARRNRNRCWLVSAVQKLESCTFARPYRVPWWSLETGDKLYIGPRRLLLSQKCNDSFKLRYCFDGDGSRARASGVSLPVCRACGTE